ncbi:MAG: UDP-N-acetylglucosamine 1-carboxyvinyltransferase, partial [Protaetiibacter sp.]
MNLARDAQKAGARVGLTSDSIVIHGGKPLTGRIEVRGAKNLATKAMVAALLGDTPSLLQSVPEISDVDVVTRMLGAYGVGVSRPAEGELLLDPAK